MNDTMSESGTNLIRYVGNDTEFPILKHWDFFNHAGVAPVPHRTAAAMALHAAQSEAYAYVGQNWYTEIEKLRILTASILNAHRDEIAFVKNTSEGISIVASGLDWQWGDRIVATGVEYPANIYPWMEVARSRGAKLIMVAEETDTDGRKFVPVEKILHEAADPRTRLVSLSHVEFASGQRHDLATIGAFCRRHGKLFNVDAIQSIGILPVDVKAMHIDYLSADGHKWMLGPEGAGIFYCRRELIERTRPLMVGWMNVINAEQYGSYNYILKSDAGRFECGTYNVPGLIGMKASLELLFSRVGLDAISARVKHLTDRLIAGLAAKGYHILSPRGESNWSGIVSFESKKHDHAALFRMLRKDHRTEIALREGRLRAAPHFYNTDEQIDRLIEHLPGH
jgi:cysteine desulfurase/selenocysteine lyase